jgi:hypothetical protein
LPTGEFAHEQLVISDDLGRDDIQHTFRSPDTLIQIFKIPSPGETPKNKYENHKNAINRVKNDVDAALIFHCL